MFLFTFMLSTFILFTFMLSTFILFTFTCNNSRRGCMWHRQAVQR